MSNGFATNQVFEGRNGLWRARAGAGLVDVD
jgi:hypothetical protein